MSLRQRLSLAAASFAFAAAGAIAQQPYKLLSPPQPTESGGKIEVTEFFWYGCPHCYALEPNVAAWSKKTPPDVVFKRVHALPSDSWAEHARIFYTLESMNKLEEMHQKVFDAIHKQNINLANKKLREEWLAKNGIDPAKYAEVEKSFTVATKMNRAKQLTYAYKVDSVPRLYVNGKYQITMEAAGSIDRVFQIVDQVVGIA
ncbi:MAG TPA: thiol:disulfide interchange protein DsbA/DsbL, partial [Usitatibacter sp.]|nr:thiol:disulfide interchange protein DsbA/DsbL [Usitatibacter sp.]